MKFLVVIVNWDCKDVICGVYILRVIGIDFICDINEYIVEVVIFSCGIYICYFVNCCIYV